METEEYLLLRLEADGLLSLFINSLTPTSIVSKPGKKVPINQEIHLVLVFDPVHTFDEDDDGNASPQVHTIPVRLTNQNLHVLLCYSDLHPSASSPTPPFSSSSDQALASDLLWMSDCRALH